MKILTKTVMVFSLLSSVALAAPTAEQKFAKADANGDGVLNSTEFYDDMSRKMTQKTEEGKALKGVSTAPQFDQVDANHDRKITFKEYDVFHTVRQKEMIEIRNKNGGRGKGLQLFQQYDKNNDGCIDKNEFSQHYESNSP